MCTPRNLVLLTLSTVAPLMVRGLYLIVSKLIFQKLKNKNSVIICPFVLLLLTVIIRKKCGLNIVLNIFFCVPQKKAIMQV